jgi:hypothetical protein
MTDIANATKPARTGLLDLLLLALAGAALRLSLSAALRPHAAFPSAAAWGFAAASALAALAVLWQFFRIWRRREDWTLSLAAGLLFIVFYKVVNNRPEISALELPLAVLLLAPAALLIWAFVRSIRRADELQRKILFEALALAFVVQFATAIVYAFLEGLDVRRPPSILWASLLVISWSVGLAIASRRYE